jgi:hypothetical protein
MRAAQWNFRLSSFSMHRDHDLAFMPLLMFSVIDAAALPDEPFPERAAFHCIASVDSFDLLFVTSVAQQRLAWRISTNLNICANSHPRPLICINEKIRSTDRT